MKDKLQIFVGGDQPYRHDMIYLQAGDVMTFLAEATRSGDEWLQDFADDKIALSRDLYDVLMAYKHYHRDTA